MSAACNARARLPERIRESLSCWAHVALPEGQRPAAHHKLLIHELEAVQAGANDRLMVLMPPGSAKSTYGSVLFPAWWFARQPCSNVIACAHTAALAGSFGARVRGLLRDHAPVLGVRLGHTRARHDFVLQQGGSYYATGVHGAITGRRADLILIDDPVRSVDDATSEQRRDHLWNWYRSDLLTRLKPRGRVVLIMTRWHEDDLGGRLLESEPGWRCLRLPALAEVDDPMGRAPGEPLWPEWENHEQLTRKRMAVGERQWAALFQQSPRPPTPLLFKVDRLGVTDTANPLMTVRGWDLAATEQSGRSDPDWTVGIKLGQELSGRFVVLDVVRLRGTPHAVEEAIVRTAALDGMATLISLPQDPGQAGKAQTRYLTSRLAGFRVRATSETGSKQTRAAPVASQIEAGNFALLRADWNRILVDELRDFPQGHKDDQVDALSRAFTEIVETRAPARRLMTGMLTR